MSAYGWVKEVIELITIGVSCLSGITSSPLKSVKDSSWSWYRVLAGSQVSVSLVNSMRGYNPESHSLNVGLCTGKYEVTPFKLRGIMKGCGSPSGCGATIA
jgi:hypothetical protein